MRVKKRDTVVAGGREGDVLGLSSDGRTARIKWDGNIGDHGPPYRRGSSPTRTLKVIKRKGFSEAEFDRRYGCG